MGATRILLAVLAAQTALILYLTVRSISIEARIGELAEAVAISRAETPPHARNDGAGERSSTSPTPAANSASPDEIRAIVRNEMDALAWRILNNQESPRPAPIRPAPKPSDVAALNAAIASELNSFLANGRATPGEMHALQQKIARLPPGEREKALGELTKAMNDGRLDARF